MNFNEVHNSYNERKKVIVKEESDRIIKVLEEFIPQCIEKGLRSCKFYSKCVDPPHLWLEVLSEVLAHFYKQGFKTGWTRGLAESGIFIDWGESVKEQDEKKDEEIQKKKKKWRFFL